MNEVRRKKVESLIQEVLSRMILTQEIKDPRVNTFLSVARVNVSSDLSHSKVYISSFQPESKVEKAVEALNHASGFIHGLLVKRLALRSIPRLQFIADDSIAHSMELNRMIDAVNEP